MGEMGRRRWFDSSYDFSSRCQTDLLRHVVCFDSQSIDGKERAGLLSPFKGGDKVGRPAVRLPDLAADGVAQLARQAGYEAHPPGICHPQGEGADGTYHRRCRGKIVMVHEFEIVLG